MFRCDFCGNVAPAGARRVLIVTEVSDTVHPMRSAAQRFKRDRFVERMPDHGGRGLQIKREKSACPKCAEQHKGEQPQTVAPDDQPIDPRSVGHVHSLVEA